MARKFRRTRRKRGAGGTETKKQYLEKKMLRCGSIQADIAEARKDTSLADLQKRFQSDLDWCNNNYFTGEDVKLGGKKSRRKRRRRTKKRKSRRRKKRTRRRRRKKR